MKVVNIKNLRKKFNKAFNLPMAKKPRLIEVDRVMLQGNMMNEELEEYMEAETITDVADALIDMQEILFGMFAEHGMLDYWEQMYIEVHKSNMSKLDDNGKPIINGENGAYDSTRPIGKVLKSYRFKEPDFKRVLGIK